MNNKVLRIVIIIVAVVVIGNFAKDSGISSVVTVGISSVTGAPVSIGGFSLGIFKQSVRIRNFKLGNPKGFPSSHLLDIPTIDVDYDLGALFQKKIYIKRMVLDLREAVIIKNQEGKLNVDALKVVEKSKEEKKGTEAKSPDMALKIDQATLSIGKVIFKDFSSGKEPVVQVYDVNIKDKTYKDINSAEQFITLVLLEAMKPTAIKNAAVYGAATVLGVAFLPAGVAAMLSDKDSAEAYFNASMEKVYATSLDVLKKSGKILDENKNAGLIKADVNGANVTLTVTKKSSQGIQVIVKARKLLIPQPQTAGGIIYQITEKLK